jgi:hypothetical protein
VMLLVSSVQFHAIIDAMPSTHNREDLQMTHITYEIVEHDGGWAYRVDGVVSQTFPSHDAARRAAERAAAEQRVPGNTTGISYEDNDGRWHDELYTLMPLECALRRSLVKHPT